ncbi:MAG: PQQ-binding-like beta-propeller repeat protein [Verrucomicrobia bacterium]|nr:PQQ-binding-like beta-propeller repeat protein [Verrucomicrobiota bacterium]
MNNFLRLLCAAALVAMAGRLAAAEPGAKLWEFTTGAQPVQSSAALGADGTIYIGSDNGKLAALLPSGAVKWEFAAGANIVAAPALGPDGTIYFGSVDRNLYAVKPDGKERWRFKAGGGIVSSPALGADGTIYVGSVFNQLLAIAPDGHQRWEFAVGGNVISSPAVGADGTIYVGAFNDKFYAVTPAGEKKWDFTAGGKINSSPALGPDGAIYFGAFDGRLYALNANGTRRWFYAANGAIRGSPAIGPDGTIYVGSDDRNLYAINPDGSQKWSFAAGEWIRGTPAVAADGTVYFGSYDKNFYALDATGKKLWAFATGATISSSPAIGVKEEVYFGSWDGKFYALQGTAPLASGGWPKFRGNAAHTAKVGEQPSLRVLAVAPPVVPPPAAAGPAPLPKPTVTVTAPDIQKSLLKVDIIGRGRVTPPLNGEMLEVGKSYTLRAEPERENQFQGWSGGASGDRPDLKFVMRPNLVLQANFIGSSDRTPPAIEILAPLDNSRLPNPVFLVRGTAKDNVGVARVLYHFGDGDFKAADGTANWTIRRAAVPGTNTVFVKCVDIAGNESPTITRSFQFVVLSHFKLETQGAGTVTPEYRGRMLEVGKSYTLTAEPKKDYLFAGWTGGFESTEAKLTFQMRSNLTLKAVFVPLPFQSVQGSYRGLFFETNGVAPESSGFFTLTVNPLGAFTGSFQFAGTGYPLNGQFDTSGAAQQFFNRRGKSQLTLDLRLDLKNGSDQISGQVSDGAIIATFLGDRDVFDAKARPAPQAGRYTLIIPGFTNSAASPGGDGFGSVSVDASGTVKFTGELADGTDVSQQATLSRDGVWPFYAPLYGGRGVLLGWIKFPNNGPGELFGKLNWIKPAAPHDKLYPGGFARTVSVFGSHYAPPAGGRPADLVEGISGVVRGGSLGEMLLPADQVKVTFNPATGLMNGSFVHPLTRKSVPFKGAYVQRQNWRSGYYLLAGESGCIFFGPTP